MSEGQDKPAEHADADRTLVRAARAGERAAVARLVARLTPVIQARVARCVLRFRPQRAQLRQDVEDLTQDVFLRLFEDSGRVLDSWEPARGLSLENFAGLVAERHAISALRTGKRNPWRETEADEERLAAEPAANPGPAQQVAEGDLLERLLDRLRESLSPLGMRLFDLLYIQERSVEDVCAATQLSSDAVYAWRSRLRRTAQALHAELVSEGAGSPRMSR